MNNIFELNQKEISTVAGCGNFFHSTLTTETEGLIAAGVVSSLLLGTGFAVGFATAACCIVRGWKKLSANDATKVAKFAGLKAVEIVIEEKKTK